jgi:hypothetical protein
MDCCGVVYDGLDFVPDTTNLLSLICSFQDIETLVEAEQKQLANSSYAYLSHL